MNPFDAEKLGDRFEKLSEVTNPYQRRCELIQIARDFNLTSEEVNVLWEDYCFRPKETSPDPPVFRRVLDKATGEFKTYLGYFETFWKISIFTGAILFIVEAGTREKTAINDAWRNISEVQAKLVSLPSNGNEQSNKKIGSGIIGSLEFLNRGCVEEKEHPLPIRNFPIIKYFFADCVELKNINLPSVSLIGLSLPWSYLREAQLPNTDLTGVDFSQAKLQDANLSGADLSNTNLKESVLESADLKSAKLMKANLQKANLFKANITDANLSKADLRGAELVNTVGLDRAILANAVYDDTNPEFTKSILASPEYKDKNIIYLKRGTDLEKTPLESSDLEEINLKNADLQYVNLRKANLRNTNLQNANLQNSDLTGADLRGADLRNVMLHGTILKNAIYDENTKFSPLFYINLKLNPQKYQLYFISNNKNLTPIIFQKNINVQKLSIYNLKKKELFSNIRLSSINLNYLKQANLENMYLQYSKNNTNLTPLIFQEDSIDLQKTNLLDANLKNLKIFKNANLQYANLRKADLRGVNLQNVNLQYAYYDAQTKLDEENRKKIQDRKNLYYLDTAKDLKYAYLKDADLSKINLASSILNAANLNNANLTQADLNHIQFIKADLTRANLSESNLSDATLNKAILTKAILANATLKKAFLNGAKLEGARLSGSNLERAELKEANLQKANLTNAKLKGANLDKANLEGANLENVDLEGVILTRTNLRNVDLSLVKNLDKAKLEYAYYDSSTKFPDNFQPNKNKKFYKLDKESILQGASLNNAKIPGINLERAKLQKAYLKSADLRGAILKQAKLQEAKLQGADMRGTILEQAELQKAEFHNTDIRGVNFLESADLEQAIFKNTYFDKSTKFPPEFQSKLKELIKSRKLILIDQGSDLRNYILESVKIPDANLEDADLKGVILTKAVLENANLKNAKLTGANLKDANLTNVDLTGADLEKADLTGAVGLTVDQVKQAKNWKQAIYSEDFKKKLIESIKIKQ